MPVKIIKGRQVYIYQRGEHIRYMYSESPYCHWCGIKTELSPESEESKGITYPKNMATRDHIFHREFHKRLRTLDKIQNGGRSSVVLACHACNHRRGIIHNSLIAQW